VSESDRSSSWVNVVLTKTENFSVRFYDGGKGFIELPDGNVLFLKTRLLEELLNAGCWGDGEIYGVWYMLALKKHHSNV
jgi:hypothetical protein